MLQFCRGNRCAKKHASHSQTDEKKIVKSILRIKRRNENLIKNPKLNFSLFFDNNCFETLWSCSRYEIWKMVISGDQILFTWYRYFKFFFFLNLGKSGY